MSSRIHRGTGAVSTGVVAVTLSALIATTAVGRSQTPVARASSLAITNVTVIDTVSGALQPDMTVVVTGERIAEVALAARVRVPEGARHVHGRGRFLIPGLWDMHVHCYHTGTLPLFVANGVTGARVTLGTPVHHRWRGEIAAGTLVGPRFVIGGRLIDGPKPVFDANPLAAIGNTTRINAVVANGRLFRRADLDDLLAKAEAAANK
jgi:hypothetical protein